MTTFSDLGIGPPERGLIGHKIELRQVLNKKLLITDYKVEPSKHKAGQQCLHLQFEIGEAKHVLFTGSVGLLEMCSRVPKEKLPVTATIEYENNRYIFK